MLLSASIVAQVTFQEYAPASPIDGVVYTPLKKHRALEGAFMEHLRVTDGKVEGLSIDFEVRQVSVAVAVPHRINAFHLHPKRVQDELWCVIQGRMLVWLVDLRDGSPTQGRERSYVLDGEQPALLYIPSGVAHGYKAGSDGAILLYAMNSQFDLHDPNEGRLPWDFFGTERWEEDRG
jgi:dTDP-4-dehydrorhamnose 3,5-epimerase